ncbi:MAG: putative transcriptional regulator [Clostridia bacterium]|nr:putative transcriptional regulator [Clostridia bacterium]
MDYNNNLGHLLSKAARMTKCDFSNRLSQYEITPAQWGVLKDISIQEALCISEEEKMHILTPAAIADRIHADRPTISGVIDRLVKQQLVNRISNPKDRRSQVILLTDKARTIIPELEALSDLTAQYAVEGFSEDEVKQFEDFLQRVIKNFK